MDKPSEFLVPVSSNVRLFVVSVLVLFLELALIRFASAHVLYLGYFSNLALIGCFLGFGLGLFVAGKPFNWTRVVPYALAALIALVLLFKVEVLIGGGNEIHFTSSSGMVELPIWAIILPLFMLLVLIFIGPSQEMGRLFKGKPPLAAYTVNIAGSLAGIVLFYLASLFSLGANLWFGLSAILFLFVARKGKAVVVEALLLFACVTAVSAYDYDARWSPYYRVQVYTVREKTPNQDPLYILKVNSISHQVISHFKEREVFYEFPYKVLLKQLDEAPDVLVIGSGVGTDVSFGLAYAAAHIDAVEIDPAIAELGRDLNPTKPYQDPRTTLHVDDGRSFLGNTDKKYDLVAFGLPDSLSLVSSYSSVRLESFLFTTEAFESISKVLKEDGLFVAYNYFREEWLVERIAQMLEVAFGEPPVVLIRPQTNMTAVFFAGPMAKHVPESLGKEFGFVRKQYPSPTKDTLLASDNWPFLYLKTRSIPGHYVWVLAFLFAFAVAAFGVLGRGMGTGRIFTNNLHLFFTGAAFLLLETASIVRGYLLFGSTWTSNAYVFAIIMVLILAANWLVMKYPPKTPYVIGTLLIGSLVAAYLVPLHVALELGTFRYVAVGLLMLFPVFFANILFARFFSETDAPHLGLAANITGAILGGVAEYSAMALGYRTMYVLAGFFYLASLVSWAIIWRKRGACDKG